MGKVRSKLRKNAIAEQSEHVRRVIWKGINNRKQKNRDGRRVRNYVEASKNHSCIKQTIKGINPQDKYDHEEKKGRRLYKKQREYKCERN